VRRETLKKVSEIIILPPQDVLTTLRSAPKNVTTTILDPWYNKGVGGLQEDYFPWLYSVVSASFEVSQHVFLWGFPEIVYKVLDNLPPNTELVSWLTWFYKNCPSVIRGWRSAQFTCLHLRRLDARMYPEHFLNEVQLEKLKNKKLRYMPGPPNVLESPLNIGFVGRKEQTGHPAQKPKKVIEPLIQMTTVEGDLVLDPMCGSGTTGEVCRDLGRDAILSDVSEQYLSIAERRLGVARNGNHSSPKYFFSNL
jgi:site-specific DNA-methyltransferase (adenine-specific)